MKPISVDTPYGPIDIVVNDAKNTRATRDFVRDRVDQNFLVLAGEALARMIESWSWTRDRGAKPREVDGDAIAMLGGPTILEIVSAMTPVGATG